MTNYKYILQPYKGMGFLTFHETIIIPKLLLYYKLFSNFALS